MLKQLFWLTQLILCLAACTDLINDPHFQSDGWSTSNVILTDNISEIFLPPPEIGRVALFQSPRSIFYLSKYISNVLNIAELTLSIRCDNSSSWNFIFNLPIDKPIESTHIDGCQHNYVNITREVNLSLSIEKFSLFLENVDSARHWLVINQIELISCSDPTDFSSSSYNELQSSSSNNQKDLKIVIWSLIAAAAIFLCIIILVIVYKYIEFSRCRFYTIFEEDVESDLPNLAEHVDDSLSETSKSSSS